MAKALVLYSGGLDSLLAGRVLMEQGIEVVGLNFILPFIGPHIDPDEFETSKMAQQINMPLIYHRCGRDYLDMVENPSRGYGKRMNPCIDCKIHFITKSVQYMNDIGADFVATGEVVGQRPMSQLKHTLNHILKETHLEGRLLRPLSAQLLKPTLVEEEGLVDREKLFGISGRGRKMQLELAREYGITDFSSPAGGCLFTDPGISLRVKDIFEADQPYEVLDFYILTIGRHFRLHSRAKVAVARNEQESDALVRYKEESDVFFSPEFKGPTAFGRGIFSEEDIQLVGKMLYRYGKPLENPETVLVNTNGQEYKITVSETLTDDQLSSIRI
jgi:tRNA-specific 2-thiouridylase